MPGTKKLSVPRISSSFKLNAPEVMSLCSQGAIYISSKQDPFKKECIDVEDDDVQNSLYFVQFTSYNNNIL